jgi:hypothetical protein
VRGVLPLCRIAAGKNLWTTRSSCPTAERLDSPTSARRARPRCCGATAVPEAVWSPRTWRRTPWNRGFVSSASTGPVRLATAHRVTEDLDAVTWTEDGTSAAPIALLVEHGATRSRNGVDLGDVHIDLIAVSDYEVAQLPNDVDDAIFVISHTYDLASATWLTIEAQDTTDAGGARRHEATDDATTALQRAEQAGIRRVRRLQPSRRTTIATGASPGSSQPLPTVSAHGASPERATYSIPTRARPDGGLPPDLPTWPPSPTMTSVLSAPASPTSSKASCAAKSFRRGS